MGELLRAEGISMHFGGLKAVESVSMTIETGEVLGIIGPNGAGKTTFFNVCSGIYRPTAGKIFFEGEEITGVSSDQIARRGIARTFQNIKLFSFMSVLENVKVGFHSKTKTNLFDAIVQSKRYRKDEAYVEEQGLKILEMVGLKDYVGQQAGNLPYGLQRRLEIARALALQPKLLMLDEPAAGMNPKETGELIAFIHELKEAGHTVCVIEHDMKFVMNTCGRIIVLNFGEKISEGTPEQVRADKGVQIAYFGKGIAMKHFSNGGGI